MFLMTGVAPDPVAGAATLDLGSVFIPVLLSDLDIESGIALDLDPISVPILLPSLAIENTLDLQSITIPVFAPNISLEAEAEYTLDPVTIPVYLPDPTIAEQITSSVSQVSQNGITWTFDTNYTVGQYANGDYWVLGPITLTATDPSSVSGAGRVMNGSMIDPDPGNSLTQGYDSEMYASYGPYWNADMNIATQLPYDITVGSIVSTKSDSTTTTGIYPRPTLQKAQILTVVSAQPEVGDFRPAYCKLDKTPVANESDLDYTLLTNLSASAVGEFTMSSVADYFARPWIDHGSVWESRYMHPSENMQDYGRDLATEVTVGACMMCLDYTDDEKRDLVVGMCQLGIDNYGILERDSAPPGAQMWKGFGGHAQGRKFPIVIAGHLLGVSSLSSVGSVYNEDNFGEDCQTWTPTGPGDYPPWQPTSAPASWGRRHCWNTGADADPLDYHTCCTANSWLGYVLAAKILNLKDAWNWDPLFDYTEWYIPWRRDILGVQFHYEISWFNFPLEMWDEYWDGAPYI
jgi:hypothetical protein